MLVSFLTRLTFHNSLYREVVLTSLPSNRPFLSNTLMEHHPNSGIGATPEQHSYISHIRTCGSSYDRIFKLCKKTIRIASIEECPGL